MKRSIAWLLGALLASGCTEPSPTTGNLLVTINGLPSGAVGSARVTGPSQFFRFITATTTFDKLEPGTYIVQVDTVLFENNRYGVGFRSDTVEVSRGASQTVAAQYQIASGSITIAVTGLPAGTAAEIRLTGGGVQNLITESGTLAGLTPGDYVIATDTMISTLGDHFGTAVIRDTVTVTASLTPINVNVNYALVSGTLAVNVTGLPASFDPTSPIVVTGPASYLRQVAGTMTLRGLRAGTYTVSAVNVHGQCPFIYTTPSAPQSSNVATGVTTNVTVGYTQTTPPPQDLNLRIDAVHLIQVTQTYAGTVPMIAGKPAVLRVFGVANQCNTATPSVRVTLSTGAPITLTAQEASVRRVPAEGVLLSTWNVTLPGNVVQPGLTVFAEIDPANTVAEANEGDNRFPAAGTRSLDVRPGPTVGVRLVPVEQTVNGESRVGDVTSANLDAFMDLSRRMHPVSAYDVDIRPTYTTSLSALGAQGANWTTLLSEINNLRGPDGSLRYYYAVAKVTYQSGVAGIAYVPGKAGLGWDYLPSGSEVMAHELGHNYARFHTPCGQPSGVDPNYPATGLYAGGKIGAYGYDAVTGTIKEGDLYSDIMGYCDQKWISDYTYVGMFDYLVDPARGASLPVIGSEGAQPSLLIWGHIENGVPVLEPAFEISARPDLPTAPGPNRISAVDASGSEIFALSFAAQRVADIPGDNEVFSFVVPYSALRGRTLSSLRLSARGRTVSSASSGDVAADPRASMVRAGARHVRVRWDAQRFPVVMVRDANGQVLSFARGGDATVRTDRNELELNFSNRVRSSRRLQRIQ